MDTRKVTLVAVIALIALLAVGAGYAYTAYTANSGNETDVSYIKVTQTGTDATPYTFADNVVLKYNTYNETNVDTIYYQFPNATDLTLDTVHYSCAVLGTITFKTTFEGTASLAPAELALTVSTSDNFNAGGDWAYFITNEAKTTVYAYKNTSTETAAKAWTTVSALPIVKTNDAYPDTTICVLYGCIAKNTQGDYIDLGDDGIFYKTTTAPQKLSAGKLVFKVTSEVTVKYDANNGTTQAETYKVEKGVTDYALLANKPASFTIPENKTFLGWNTDKNATTVLSGLQTINADTVYYAIWGNTNP